ncbi:D-alanyl-D-alanine carboxypeptidase [Seinonella peptonophila]|uniref:D-alanyl-D-alanine carboxypeptidase n=1 Tax=Seinonella peptonophila TaxID=112248 RepID=A0A1M4X2F6_9BACL|nr:M15 family metallopeptidase [Seinonella peptonophila]SHE87669.1 D-alanyl-D-alanine carboxypeptidase [Seinonella peptonophila]
MQLRKGWFKGFSIIIGLMCLIGCTMEPPKIVKRPEKIQVEQEVNQKVEVIQENQSKSVPKVDTSPESITVLVNKKLALTPKNYKPNDLVFPKVPFTSKGLKEIRQLRKEPAEKLEKMFKAAEIAGYPLKGHSGYRSYETQTVLFDSYVKRDGLKKAKTFSAEPGTSEHQTGLSIDVAGKDGRCAASSCFAYKKEAKWIAENSWKYGYIVRYPKGKEAVTGYKYEPWHIRYVGLEVAKDLYQNKITLEEYYNSK